MGFVISDHVKAKMKDQHTSTAATRPSSPPCGGPPPWHSVMRMPWKDQLCEDCDFFAAAVCQVHWTWVAGQDSTHPHIQRSCWADRCGGPAVWQTPRWSSTLPACKVVSTAQSAPKKRGAFSLLKAAAFPGPATWKSCLPGHRGAKSCDKFSL